MKRFKGQTILLCLLMLVAAFSVAYADGGSAVQMCGGVGCALAFAVVPSELMLSVEDYFARYPQSNECYENGGVLFHDRGPADSYGKTDTKRYDRNDLGKQADSTSPADSLLLPITEVEIDTLAYEQLKAYVINLKLEVADQKKATLVETLKSYKDNLKQA